MLHPLAEINNHLVEGLVDIGASMFVMSIEIFWDKIIQDDV
jgi:hypothetical protein